jgi:hypothetical protein
MCYNTFTNRVGSETQLFQHPSISGVEVVNDRATTQYTKNGVNPNIVVLGTSGEVLKQTVAAGAKYGDPASGSTTGSGSGPRVNVIFDQAQLDPISKSSFCIDGTTNYSFVTTASTQELVKLAQANGLGGVGFYSTFASNSGTGATSINKPLNAYQNVVAPVIGGQYLPPPIDSIPPADTIHLPPPIVKDTVVTLTISSSSLTKGQRLTILGTTSVPPISFDVWIDGKWWKWNPTTPFTNTVDTLSVGTHTISGYVKWSATNWSKQIIGGTVTVSGVIVPQVVCNYDSVKNLWYAIGVTDGKRSVSVIDTTGYWAIRFNLGWNAAIDATPATTTGVVTLTQVKPAKR